MTSKRTTKSDPAASGSAAAGIRKTRRTVAKHSAASVAGVEQITGTTETVSVDTEAIARLAYSFYEARGYAPGSPEEDWLRAERELMAR
ncbi:MAG TPA: DUF2934 domain-containing protein [Bryobacteraceae bacterium]|jgi:DUF2934 family protein|nr:DUF2934 domain-containing protein [Bryobacteraceae bacterium]